MAGLSDSRGELGSVDPCEDLGGHELLGRFGDYPDPTAPTKISDHRYSMLPAVWTHQPTHAQFDYAT